MRFLLAVAWRNLWRHGRRSLITASAMAVALALCMGSLALSDGMFAQFHRVLVVQTLGHVQVHHPDYPHKRQLHFTIPDADAVVAALRQTPGVDKLSARVFGHGLLGSEETSTGARLLGVTPADELALTHLDDKLDSGRFLADAPAGEVVLGAKLAETLKAEVGAELVLITQASDGSMGTALLNVVGIARTGSAALDRAGAFVHIDDLREVLVLDDQLHEVLLTTPEVRGDADALAAATRAALGDRGLLVRTWKEADPNVAEMLSTSDAAIWVFLVIIFGVASLGVLNTMLMAVLERTRELGVLQALGLGPWRLMALIILESALLAALSAAAGLVLGGLMDWWMVAKGLDFSVNGEGFSQMGVMMDPIIYGQVRPERVVWIVAILFAVTVAASIWPAARAARLSPVDAMRQV